MPTSYRYGTPQTLATSTCCCTGTGTQAELGTGTNCCCPGDYLPTTLIATISGCDGGSYPIESGPDLWNSGSGQICPEIGTTSVLITFVCNGVAGGLGPDDCTFYIYMNDVAQGPFPGTLVSCVPFLWVSDPIDLSAFGCTCGTFVVTVTE